MKYIVKAWEQKKVTDYLFLLSILIVTWNFIAHGCQALIVSKKYIPLVEYVGIKTPFAYFALIFIGLIDCAVAALMIMQPRTWVLIYAALWPIVPLSLEYRVNGELEIVGKAMIWMSLVFAYFYIKKHKHG